MNEIRYLASTYFHPDYDLEANSPVGVVVKFREAESSATISALRREIVQLLSDERDDNALAAAWLNLAGAAYDPRSDDLTFREWFSEIVKVLDGRR
ncbi:contact-dependent growth inhibition system immunity protein [Myceligenerans pegani]|uniref:CdiI immunity protein domain-containing protein n=1 Tax=Myceligenerans pegani TaxID=2776917 RepID=A0ABR9MVA6_9MICO|nr:contact-dependent growth inhibition system immunity protein [Myceligenerans sp. TRM 65318]MBE1874793.1 hypothetical protein [Myceligenerans sp. TRM 65318]MBE3017064.1 hypothetical protein [Myceligenerans sp. TRM 65318]